MRFGRIAKVQLLESHIVDKHMPTVSLSDMIEGLFDFDIEEDSIVDILSRSTKEAPELKENWIRLEEDETSRKFKATGNWREFKSDEIVVNEQLGEFPFNIVEWKHEFDIDIEMSLESSGAQKIEYDEGDLDEIDEEDYNKSDIIEATITIYNPPKELLQEMGKVEVITREGVDLETVDLSHQPFRQLIILKVGYYGKHGMNVPIIFRGDIDPERGIEYIEEEGESEIIFTAQSSMELYDEADEDDDNGNGGIGLKLNGERLDKALEKIVSGTAVVIGDVTYEYEDSETGETTDITVPEIEIEQGESILGAVDEVVSEVNDKYDFDVDENEGLKYVVEKGSVISIVPMNYVYYKGIELGPEVGLISISRQTEGRDGSVDEDEDDYELETLFLPEIEYGDVLKVKRYEGDNWRFYKVNDYIHDIPHDGAATTTMECERIEGVELIKDNETNYSIRAESPYKKPIVGVK